LQGEYLKNSMAAEWGINLLPDRLSNQFFLQKLTLSQMISKGPPLDSILIHFKCSPQFIQDTL
jgi:hypothetical protein